MNLRTLPSGCSQPVRTFAIQPFAPFPRGVRSINRGVRIQLVQLLHDEFGAAAHQPVVYDRDLGRPFSVLSSVAVTPLDDSLQYDADGFDEYRQVQP